MKKYRSQTQFFNNNRVKLNKMKVALTGASGFAGKAILKELLQRDHQVTSLYAKQKDKR